MVIANDTPYSGSHTDPLRLKHAAATKLALATPFDGEPSSVHRFKTDFIDHMKNVGLKAEFNVRVGEKPRPIAIAEDAWQVDPNRFVVQNLLDTYAGITLAQVKSTRDKICHTVAALDRIPTACDPAAVPFASKQHRSWIAEFIKNSITSNVRSTLEAYEEDHDGIFGRHQRGPRFGRRGFASFEVESFQLQSRHQGLYKLLSASSSQHYRLWWSDLAYPLDSHSRIFGGSLHREVSASNDGLEQKLAKANWGRS
jgi:hypothetical protein